MFGFFDTVESVVQDFTKAVNRLEKLKEEHEDQAEDVEARAAYMMDQAQELRKESQRASRLATKFRKFLEE